MKWFFAALTLGVSLLAFFMFFSNAEKAPKHTFVAADVNFSLPSFEPILDATHPPKPSALLVIEPTSEENLAENTPENTVIVSSEIKVESLLNDQISFYQFTQNLQEHLQRGLAVSELEALYKAGKAQDWPIDWIFEPLNDLATGENLFELNEVASLSTFSLFIFHRFFTLPTAIEMPENYNRAKQIEAFTAKIMQCELCNSNMTSVLGGAMLNDIQADTAAFSNFKIGLALASVYRLQEAASYDFSDEEYALIDVDIDLLNTSDNEYLRQHGKLAQLIRNADTKGLVLLLNDGDIMPLSSLIPFIKFSQPLSQAQSYDIIYKRLENLNKNEDIRAVLDFIIYHGQYFSIGEALELLTLIEQEQNPLIKDIKKTLIRAQSNGFTMVAKQWHSEQEKKSGLFDGVLDQKGRVFKSARAKNKLMLQMMTTDNIERMQTKWIRGFEDKALGKTLFSQMNWPALTENINLNSVPGLSWNANVTALSNAQVAHQFDTMSVMHLQLIQRLFFNKIVNQSQLDELKYLYPLLLPSEKRWVSRGLESDNKAYVVGL